MPTPSALQPVFVGGVTCDVSRWSGNWTARLAEVTTSGTTGGTRYAKVVDDPQWRAEFPLDDPNYPEVIGFTPGVVIATMYFKHSALSDKLQNTTVESVEKATDSTSDVPRVVITGRGGKLSYNIAVGG